MYASIENLDRQQPSSLASSETLASYAPETLVSSDANSSMPSQTLVSDSEKALVLDSDSAPAFETPSESNNRSGDGETGSGARKGKSRLSDGEAKQMIQVTDIMEDVTAGIDFDPELRALNSRNLEITRLLYSGLPLDDIPEGARSPSPEPVYDNLGIRINTRRYRARERLMRESQEITAQLIKKTISKPPADYRPPKLLKKLYIPLTQYPGFNFIGHIIGPRGSIQKRMEKETGAKIVIRGDGRLQHKRDSKPDPSENDDLHVLIEAETQEALDAATVMVEKLLQPVDEVVNEHKRQRLREFASLNMTIGNEEYVFPCGMLPFQVDERLGPKLQ